MMRKFTVLLVCCTLFLSLMVAAASAAERQLLGLDFGLGVFEVIDRSRLDPGGHFLLR